MANLEKAKEYTEHFKKILLPKIFSFKVRESENKEIILMPDTLLDWIMQIPERKIKNKKLREEIAEAIVRIALDLKATHEDVVKWVTRIVLELDAENNKGLE